MSYVIVVEERLQHFSRWSTSVLYSASRWSSRNNYCRRFCRPVVSCRLTVGRINVM